MAEEQQLDIFRDQGRKRRDRGIEVAHDAQERRVDGWAEEAYQAIRTYVATLPRGSWFTSDRARAWIHANTALPLAKEQRAWGHVIRRGVKAGLYRHDGFTQSPDPKQHCAPATLWRVA